MKKNSTRSLVLILILICSLFISGYIPTKTKVSPAAVSIGSCQIFPDNNFWNVPIDNLPVHPNSVQWVNSIGAGETFHMDFGSGTWDGGPIGIPYNIVSGASVNEYGFDFYYPDESDPGPYPLPAVPQIEWGGDHHILIVDTDDCKLYEVYDASLEGGQWNGGSGAIWDLGLNDLRPDTWTSADAAGLPILPGLARYDEIATGVIEHALRFTANCTADYYIWPARHKAQHGSCVNPAPFGARFRLKADYDISGFSPQAQILLQAFKTYGIVLADNGSDWYVSGSPSESWDNDQLHELDVLTGLNFEAVDTSGLMVNYDSGDTGLTVSGNAETAGVTMSYTDGTPKNVMSQSNGSYSFQVPTDWSGTVTPSHACYTFTPTSLTYINITTDQNAQDYTVDLIPNMMCVLSILRVDTDPTVAKNVNFAVRFPGDVMGVDVWDFALTTTGVTGASIVGISGSGDSYIVTVKTGFGSGTIRLDVVDNNSIVDGMGNPLGGIGSGNGNFTLGETYTITKTPVFSDVPFSYLYSEYIEILYANGYTGGCSTSPLLFCPDTVMNRAQSAVFMMRGNFGSGYVPVTPTHFFIDNWADALWAEGWAESMYLENLTAGCSSSPLGFCPYDQLTNAQAAVFGLRLKYGTSYLPAVTGVVFADLTDVNFWATGWAEQAYVDGLLPECGIEIESGKPLFCPNELVSRGLGASIIVKAKNLTMP